MKKTSFLTSALAALLFALLFAASPGASAQEPPTIQLVSTFRLPGEYAYIDAISLKGDTVGTRQKGGGRDAFARTASGTVLKLQFGNFETYCTGINSSRTVCGFYSDGSFKRHGYLYNNGVYTPFEPPAGYGDQSYLYGINDAGDLAGYLYDTQAGRATPFLTRDGVFIPIDLGLNTPTSFSQGISSDGRVVGEYRLSDTTPTYGFIREADGTLLTGIADPEAEGSTNCSGINARDWVVGSYMSGGQFHGYLFIPPRTFINYDIPGAENTVFSGINDRGQISAYYFSTDKFYFYTDAILQVVE